MNRWQQRFQNYKKALISLNKAVEIANSRTLSELEKQGLIQGFEFTHELAWKTLKDFLNEKGNQNIFGSKDATRESFNLGLITNGEVWMDMINSRNLSSHTYEEDTANEILTHIVKEYIGLFNDLEKRLTELTD